MLDLSIIILTGNEERHIGRCLDKLCALNLRQIFVVDSESSDQTREVAVSKGACVVVYPWPGNQAAQFQRALDELPLKSKWILRLDADEYLTDQLVSEIKEKLPHVSDDVAGIVLKRRHIVGWLDDTWVKRGMYPTRILRLFRLGRGHSDMKVMDEHIIVNGKVAEFENDFVDHSLLTFEEWKLKHRSYARREAMSYVSGEKSTGEKAKKKDIYYKLPRYLRVVLYWCSRFFVKGACFEGFAAWRWCWYHALWYRMLVDCEIARLRRT